MLKVTFVSLWGLLPRALMLLYKVAEVCFLPALGEMVGHIRCAVSSISMEPLTHLKKHIP